MASVKAGLAALLSDDARNETEIWKVKNHTTPNDRVTPHSSSSLTKAGARNDWSATYALCGSATSIPKSAEPMVETLDLLKRHRNLPHS